MSAQPPVQKWAIGLRTRPRRQRKPLRAYDADNAHDAFGSDMSERRIAAAGR